MPADIYAQVARAKPRDALLLLDGYKGQGPGHAHAHAHAHHAPQSPAMRTRMRTTGVAEALDSGGVDILKINVAELQALLRGAAAGAENDDNEALILACIRRGFGAGGPLRRVRMLALTNGRAPAYLAVAS